MWNLTFVENKIRKWLFHFFIYFSELGLKSHILEIHCLICWKLTDLFAFLRDIQISTRNSDIRYPSVNISTLVSPRVNFPPKKIVVNKRHLFQWIIAWLFMWTHQKLIKTRKKYHKLDSYGNEQNHSGEKALFWNPIWY